MRLLRNGLLALFMSAALTLAPACSDGGGGDDEGDDDSQICAACSDDLVDSCLEAVEVCEASTEEGTDEHEACEDAAAGLCE